MTPEQFLKPARGEPAINPSRFVNMTAAEFAERWSFTPDRHRTRTALEELVAADTELRRQGQSGAGSTGRLQDRDQQLTLEFLQHHNIEAWPA